jgi:hypothetical protein
MDAHECQGGFECVRVGGTDTGQCRHYCCDGRCDNPASSGGKTFCDIQFTRATGLKVPACLPVRSCKLLTPKQCNTGETCAVVRDEDGSTGCVDIGPAKVGQSCDEVHCAEGLTCLGVPGSRTCLQLCRDVDMPCPGGQRCLWSPPTFREPGIGVCVEPNMNP